MKKLGETIISDTDVKDEKNQTLQGPPEVANGGAAQTRPNVGKKTKALEEAEAETFPRAGWR